MPKQTLAVVIITKNEEDKIARCLQSVKWADEIIVVDDLSEDKTVEICQSYGAKVISHKSYSNFDQQRNIGIDNATSDWMLQMDADEIVPGNLKQEIQKVISENTGYTAFQFRRKNFFLGHFMRYGGFYGPYALKLFKTAKGRYFRRIHETLKVEGKIGTIQADIEHYPFQSIAQNIERANIYTSIEAKSMLDEDDLSYQKKIKYNLTIRPLKIFWKMFIKRKAYKDGMYGLIFSILFTFGPMLKWMKYWELIRDKDETNLSG